jgi:glycosyltransferase involved in cell wall biosynthesis
MLEGPVAQRLAEAGNARIRVIHLITGLNLGGAERMVCRLVQNMDRARFDSVVISLLPGGRIREPIEQAGIKVHSLKITDGASSVPGALKLASLIRSIKPDLMQTWLYHADLLGVTVGRALRVPHIVWNVRGSEFSRTRSRRLQRLLGRISGTPDGVVVNSLHGKLVHEAAGYRPRWWRFIPNGFDTDYFKPRPECRKPVRNTLAIPDRNRVVGMIARYHPMKDHALFLKAARRLAGALPDVHFVLAGPDVTPANVELTEQVSPELKERLHLIGPRSDVPELFSAFDVATLTSAYGEGFPNVVGEAMACGVPCVVTDSGDASAIVGSTGWTVPTGNEEALVRAWTAALSTTEADRAERGRNARLRIIESFSLMSVVKQYEELYAWVIAQGRSAVASRQRPSGNADYR